MKEMRVFISQPMNGREMTDIVKQRSAAIDRLKRLYPDRDIFVIDNISKHHNGDVSGNCITPRVYNLGHSILYLSYADICVFLPDWEEARGCRIEYDICKLYEIPTLMMKRGF